MSLQRFIASAGIVVLALLCGHGAFAQTSGGADQPEQAGLWLLTDYPELNEQAGEEARIPITLRNSNVPPARVELAVEGLPDGWSWQMLGGSAEIKAAIVGPDESRNLTLVLTPPEGADDTAASFRVVGRAPGQELTLPITVNLVPSEPAKLVLTPELPALRGTPSSSFDFQVSVNNDSTEDATVNLIAQAPEGFTVAFKEEYGTQELTSLPVKAGETKKVKVSVQPPSDASANEYPVLVQAATADTSAETQLVLQVTGKPSLALSGPGGRLSGQATAGEAETFTFTLQNDGSAPARDVRLTASTPQGWKVTFSPETLPGIAANGTEQVQVEITPSEKAITGDYMVTIRANGDGASDSAEFRVTVATSTVWGVAGLGIIGAAVVVLGLAVTRYGRR